MAVPSIANATAKQTVLHNFAGGATDGATPISGLIRLGKLFYGTSGGGGTYGKGTVFSISPSGANFTVLHSFAGKDEGTGSPVGLTNLGDTLYGTTEDGGTLGKGTVFSITPGGAFTTLYSFKGGRADGARPTAPLKVLGGMLYGTTANGGNNDKYLNPGTFFSISTSGQEKMRYSFGSKDNDGLGPSGPLVLLGGKFYGTTNNGGSGGVFGDGTIFSVTPGGQENVVYRLKNNPNGSCSFNCYLTVVDGSIYGTATTGGKDHIGSVFSITPAGAFKTLYSASSKDKSIGGYPSGALTDAAGKLYGTMNQGPTGKEGTVFSITPGSPPAVIYTFVGGNEGARPASRLSLSDGKLFGTTNYGGTTGRGTIYSISGL
jgi:uncharacterized repeat protein (TIGR03803 family)